MVILMDGNNYKNYLLRSIRPWAKSVSGGTEIQCRCFYCPDSKDQKSGHFYISVPQDTQTVSMFHCKKCGAHGMVTHTKLQEWNIYEPEIAIELTQHNKTIFGSHINPYSKNGHLRYSLKHTAIRDDKLTKYKLKYINDRLGLNLSYQDCLDSKIVLNLIDLLSENMIEKLTRYPNVVEQLDTNFVGFLSYDNSRLNMRNIELPNQELFKSINKRYINYNIFEDLDNTTGFYAIPNMVDLSIPQPVKLHIAEGPFDILSIKYNLRKDMFQNIFIAVQGNQYKGAIRYFISQLKIINMEIHLYLDNDASGHHIMRDIVDYITPFGYPLYIHHNRFTGEKDFGVSLNRIKESVDRLM